MDWPLGVIREHCNSKNVTVTAAAAAVCVCVRVCVCACVCACVCVCVSLCGVLLSGGSNKVNYQNTADCVHCEETNS